MPNLRSILLPLNVAAFLAFSLHIHAATDGSWSSNASGNRDYGDTAYWAGSIIADGADAVALFNVNLTNDISVTNIMGRTLGHLYFQDTDTNSGSAGGWNLGSAGETALTLDVASGRSVIGVGNLNVGGGKKVSVIAPIANADGILKMGVGQLSIRAASPAFAADFKSAGGLTDTRSALANVTSLWLVNGAQFQVDFINAPINTVNLVNPAAPVTLGGNLLMPLPVIPPLLPLAATNLITGGATLTSSGRTNSVNTQVVASVTFNAGTHIVSVTTPGVNATNVFDPTNLSRNPGAVVNLTTSGAGLTLLMAGGLANDARGIIGGWAISGTNWAMVSPTNTIIPMTTYQTALSPASWAATDNVSLGTAASGPIGNQTINTLRVTATSTNVIGTGNTLALTDGGLLFSAGSSRINGGTLTGPAGGGELVVYQNTGSGTTGSGIGSVIADNGGPVTLVKSGGGYLYLNGLNPNTYSGGTIINQGAVQVGDFATNVAHTLSLGTGPVQLVGGSLIFNCTNDLTITNFISGSGLVIKQGPGMVTLSGSNYYNGFNLGAPGYSVTGVGGSLGAIATRHDGGTVAVATDNALGGTYRNHAANVTLRSADMSTRTLPNAIDVATAPWILGTADSGNLVFTGPLDTGNGSKTFNVSNVVTRFEGPLRQNTAPLANTLTKAGPGVLELANVTNGVTKPWIITGGTLRISDEGQLGLPPAAPLQHQVTLNGGTLETTATMALDDYNRGLSNSLAGGTIKVAPGTTLSIITAYGITGVGPMTKAGAGELALQGTHGLTGPFIVAEGKLTLANSATLASSLLQVNSGATLDLMAFSTMGLTLASGQSLGGAGTVQGTVKGFGNSVITPGSTSPGTLTINGDLTLEMGDTLTFSLTNNLTIGSGVNDLIEVNGNLTLNNNVVNLQILTAGAQLAPGKYRLITYTGTKTGTLLPPPGARYIFTIDDATPGQINLDVSGGPANLVWKGDVSTAWDINATANWRNGGAPDKYFDFDTLTFNDSASSFTVSIDSTAVKPNAVTVDAAGSYVFGGFGALSGPMSLTKSGTGKLILGNYGANDFTGGTVINAGTLQVGQNDTSGSLPAPILNNGTLVLQNSGQNLALTGLGGTGSLSLEGVLKDVILAGSNSFSGSVLVSTNARLVLDPAQQSSLLSLGSSPSITVLTDGALFSSLPGAYSQALTLNGTGQGFGSLSGALRTTNNITWMGPITLASDSFISVDGGTLVVSNVLGGPGALSKVGVGTLQLIANNTYGATTNLVTNSIILVGNGGLAGSLGTGPVVNHGGLRFNRSDDIIVANVIFGTGGLTKDNTNTLTLLGANSYDATTSPYVNGPGRTGFHLREGTVVIGADTALGTTGYFRLENNTAVRSVDASVRTINTPVDMTGSFGAGSPTSGNLEFNGIFNIGGGAKTMFVSNAVTTISGTLVGATNNTAWTKGGPGTLILTAIPNHGRPFTVAAGTLLLNGQFGTNVITVSSNAVLGGVGATPGSVVVQAYGTLAPGNNGIGTLSVSNSLTLAGTNVMEINKTAGTRDLVQGMTNLVYGGTLVVAMIGTPAPGDSFKLYDSTAYSGAFAAIEPAIPGPGLVWDTSSLVVDGTLKVSAPANVTFSQPSLSGGVLTLAGTGGIPGTTYYVLGSTNVSLPLVNWTPLQTNTFGAGGVFSYSETVSPADPPRFYLIQVP